MENGDGNMQGITQQYNIQFATVEVEPPDMEVDTKPKVEKKTFAKKKKKAESDSDDDTFDNKLEDNPAQVLPHFYSTNTSSKWISLGR